MNIVFVIGCARSGTSILGELIGSNPKVKYSFEDPIWRRWAESDSCRLLEEEMVERRIKKIRSVIVPKAKGHKVYVEKNPRHSVRINFVKKVFPKSKIIYIIRDGRDVSCSLIPGLCGKGWAHVRPPSWKYLKENYECVERCARAWNEIVSLGKEDLMGVDHLLVKYEDLIYDPESEAERVFKYLGTGLKKKTIKFCKNIKNNTSGYKARNQTRWNKDNHTVRHGRWKENMTEAEAELVWEIIKDNMEHYGYEK